MAKLHPISRFLGRRHARYLALGSAIGAAGAGAGKLRTVNRDPSVDPVSAAVSGVVAERVDELGIRVPRFGAGLHTSDWDLPNIEHARVDYWVDRFVTVPEMHERMEGFLERSGRYASLISEKLAERRMPQDLIFLAMIESGFQTSATSSASAVGIWQFIPETGRRYGLRIDRAVDERRDPERATEAALDYLGELHERFGSWYLAAAAYNTGENRVGRLMRERFGKERANGEMSYYQIWDALPRETRDYVPLMIAAARIAKDPEAHGFGDVVPDGPEVYDEVLAERGITLEALARQGEVPLEALQDLNPQLLRGRTPDDGPYTLRVPVGTAPRVAEALDHVARDHPIRIATHTVRSGETLTHIAQRYGTSVSVLRRTNRLRGDRLVTGQTLEVPMD
ncbi:MAG TPA: transglycosylase SLT domain-containing protein [Candidatus Thermoplasmatota archaeon]